MTFPDELRAALPVQADRFILELPMDWKRANAHDLPRAVAERLECCMPHDLCFPDVLDLRRPRTDADFTDALLTGSRRLGALLP